MRALRSTVYLDPFKPPLTMVTLEADSGDTLESIRHQLLQPGAFVVHEIFEPTDDDLATAAHAATQHQSANAQQEARQALMYFWTLSRWNIVAPGGTLMMDKPAPLSREEIAVVFDQLAQHPDYRGLTIIAHTHDGEPVRLVDGKIED